MMRGLAIEDLAGIHFGAKPDVLPRRRQHPAAKSHHRSELLDGGGEVAGNLREGGQHQVADGMALEPLALDEPVLQQPLERRVGRGNSRQAVPDVTRGQHTEVAAQSPGAPALVGHRHDGGYVIGAGRAILITELAQAFQHGRKASAASHRHDARCALWHRGQVTLVTLECRSQLDGREC